MSELPQGLNNITIDVVDPPELGLLEVAGLNRLLRESVEADFPDRTAAEVAYLVGHSAAYRTDPNRGVGEAFRRGQSFDSPLTVVAHKQGEPIAYLTTANNASSRLPGPLGQGERYAKLHSEGFMNKRWHWHGMRALHPEYRHTAPSEERRIVGGLVVDILGYVANDARQPGQPGSAFPYEEEAEWRATLESWGLGPVEHSQREVQPFGPGTTPVRLERYTTPPAEGIIPAKDITHIKEQILAKEGVQEALEKVRIRRRSAV